MDLRKAIELMPTPLDEEGKLGKKLDPKTIQNALDFFQQLPVLHRKRFDPINQLTPTAHGTLTFDFFHRKSFVSIEVGPDSIAMFSDLPDGSTPTIQSPLNPTVVNIVGRCLDSLY